MDLTRIFSPVAEELSAVDKSLRALMKQVAAQAATPAAPGGISAPAAPGGISAPAAPGGISARGKAHILEGIVQHPFAVPGKKIRPALVLLTAHAVETAQGGRAPDRESLIALAGAVEVLHAASLVHDDIIDNADSRRNQVSLNRKFGNRVAVLAGDILYTHFFSVITGMAGLPYEQRFALLEIFLETTKAMCMGEIIAQEVAAAHRPLSLAEYIEIATDKTAVLFSACCRTAALLCGVPAGGQDCMGQLGLSFGLAFQMADDVVDKDHGLDETIDLKAVTALHAGKARELIATLSPGPHRNSLHDLVDYVISPTIP
jgi:octaprenyl-diphosphate synthase